MFPQVGAGGMSAAVHRLGHRLPHTSPHPLWGQCRWCGSPQGCWPLTPDWPLLTLTLDWPLLTLTLDWTLLTLTIADLDTWLTIADLDTWLTIADLDPWLTIADPWLPVQPSAVLPLDPWWIPLAPHRSADWWLPLLPHLYRNAVCFKKLNFVIIMLVVYACTVISVFVAFWPTSNSCKRFCILLMLELWLLNWLLIVLWLS